MFGKIARVVAGKSKVDDEVLDNLEEVLITSDVGVETTLNIIQRIEKRAASEKYMNAQELNPKNLQYIMGHSNISITMNWYAHASIDTAKSEVQRLIA